MAKKSHLPKAALDFFREQVQESGKKSGAARMKKLTPEQRNALAKKAAVARWAKRVEKAP